MNVASSQNLTVYTIGHSSHPIDAFIGLLRRAGITAVADVRSVPHSRRHRQFNRRPLAEALHAAGIVYVFLGAEMGARPADRGCYRAGRAEYDLIAATAAFEQGLQRVEAGARRYRVALMCAEQEPLECHRTILVARHLQHRGIRIVHLLASGTCEANEATEQRLLKRMRMDTGDMFAGARDVRAAIEEAYVRRGREICYVGGEGDKAGDDGGNDGGGGGG